MVRGGYAESSAGYGGDLQAEAQAWVEQVTGEPLEGDFADGLRDGVRLCKLLNTIKPSSVRRVNPFKEGQKFKQMENISNFIRGCRAIGVPEYSLFETVDLYEGKDVGLVVKCLMENVSNFLKACRAVGVAEHSLFETVDLYEGKDLGLVVRCLHALGQTVQNSCPEYNGPRLGIKQTEANKREWTEEQQQQQLRNSSGAMSNLLAGSSKTMERATVIKTGATFGAAQSGTGDRAGTSGWTMGSANTMDRSHIAKSGPTFGAEYAGASGDKTGASSRFTAGHRY
ncbi:conserved unknown protein [Ectocarpus siliculosus]|uniref:Calponin-homology (CH) domain-containing protein n=1 Tax=Ectocarpus siliculosus TaxID=2880 RepID=D7FNP0_ECTSI|nr:conserved unknown protein [Ectocarpus siliculosus]|eukprot:CBJ26051.1 conserved unknown protein [Ectocarpus siliculosus]